MNTKILGFATQIVVMVILISVGTLLVGIGVLVLIHVCVVGRASSRDFSAIVRPNIDGREGLSRDELEQLPCYEFKVGEKTSDVTDCAVCLESFQMGDRCRLLPACGHSFHAQCIDSWLLKSSICPICRANTDRGKGGKAAAAECRPGQFGGVNLGLEMRESQGVMVGVSLSAHQTIPHASSSQ